MVVIVIYNASDNVIYYKVNENLTTSDSLIRRNYLFVFGVVFRVLSELTSCYAINILHTLLLTIYP